MGDIIEFPDMGREFADFQATFTGMKVTKSGNLELSFVVPKEAKYNALKVTDHPGMLLRIKVEREVVVYSEQVMDTLKTMGIDEFRGDDG